MNDEKNCFLEYFVGCCQCLEIFNVDRNVRMEIYCMIGEEYENERKEDRVEQVVLEFLFRVWRNVMDGKEVKQ